MASKSDKTPPPSERTRLHRVPERGHYDKDTIYPILDEGVVCHVGIAVDGQPYVIPMAYARQGDRLLLHGSLISRLMKTLADGVDACVTVTHLDDLVLARSVFHHSMNYRSVVALGRAVPIRDEAEKSEALEVLVEHLIPGRSADARAPSEKELAATEILAFPLDEASVKIRTGPPSDDRRDLDLPVWAGLIPFRTEHQPPEPSPDLQEGVDLPDYVANYRRRG